MYLHIFNPDHDESLAHPGPDHHPSKAACGMARDLAALPIWYAQPGDLVMLPSTNATEKWLKEVETLLPSVQLYRNGQSLPPIDGIEPWGWDHALHRNCLKSFPNIELPTVSVLDDIRSLSSRRTAVEILRNLREEIAVSAYKDAFCGRSWWVDNESQARPLITAYPEGIIKAPWSGSGRGLYRTSGRFEPPVPQWCIRLLSSQGGFSFEPFYGKKTDFAFEFYADGGGNIHYTGLSLFFSSPNGAYAGNRIATQQRLTTLLSADIDINLLPYLQQLCEKHLAAILGKRYRGYLGIDMMLCQTDKSYPCIHPCVEMNLRRTMGYVALRLARLVHPESEGSFLFDFDSDSRLLAARSQARAASYPQTLKDGLLAEGYLPLTPIDGQTHFHAYLLVNKIH